MTIQALFGIAAGILAFASDPVFIADTIRGRAKPSRVSWWIFGLLNGMIATSYFASGARTTVWIPLAYSVGSFVIAVLSVKYGEGRWTKLDSLYLTGALGGALIWWVSQSSQIALFIFVFVDLCGIVPTIYKSYRNPQHESRLGWTITTAASALNLFAIDSWAFAIVLYPVYAFVTNLMIIFFLYRRKKFLMKT